MQEVYKQILNFMVKSGQRIKSRAGNIPDIGIAKQWLTEEDVAIERGFKEIISSLGNGHFLYAEEENDNFTRAEHLWVADPISNTRSFIYGLPHYAIVISYLNKGAPMFAAVYDPAMGEMYTAYKDKGAFLNDKQIHVRKSQGKPRLILNISYVGWDSNPIVPELFKLSDKFTAYRNNSSVAVNYGYVATGKFDNFISLVKDVFPEYAGSLLITEAGGVFQTLDMRDSLKTTDRVFVGGIEENVAELTKFLKIKINPKDEVFNLVHGKL